MREHVQCQSPGKRQPGDEAGSDGSHVVSDRHKCQLCLHSSHRDEGYDHDTSGDYRQNFFVFLGVLFPSPSKKKLRWCLGTNSLLPKEKPDLGVNLDKT